MTPAATLAITPADRAIARADINAALTGQHQPLTDRKAAPRRAPTDHTTVLARRLERLARAALPAELQRLRREPGEVWLLANDAERAADIDTKRARIGMALFDHADPSDVARVARNDAMREHRRVTAAGNARPISAGEGEFEIADTGMDSAPADQMHEARETMLALLAAGRIDAGWHQLQALPATCGEAAGDAEALPVAVAAAELGCSRRSVQTTMRAVSEIEAEGGQLVLPGVPRTRDVYRTRQPKAD